MSTLPRMAAGGRRRAVLTDGRPRLVHNPLPAALAPPAHADPHNSGTENCCQGQGSRAYEISDLAASPAPASRYHSLALGCADDALGCADDASSPSNVEAASQPGTACASSGSLSLFAAHAANSPPGRSTRRAIVAARQYAHCRQLRQRPPRGQADFGCAAPPAARTIRRSCAGGRLHPVAGIRNSRIGKALLILVDTTMLERVEGRADTKHAGVPAGQENSPCNGFGRVGASKANLRMIVKANVTYQCRSRRE
jgi:hypothetical protein